MINKEIKKISLIFFPILVGFIVNSLYSVIDIYWIGKILNNDSVASVTIIYPIIVIASAIASGFTNGETILISDCIGKRKQDQAKVYSSSGFTMTLLICFCLVLFLVSGYKFFFEIFNVTQQMWIDTKEYYMISIVGLFPVFLYYHFAAVLRAENDTITQMVFLMISTFINIILDPFMIGGYGIIPKLGVSGAAIATLISQTVIVCFFILYIKIYKKKEIVCIKKIHLREVLQILRISWGLILQQIIPSISLLCVTFFVSKFSINEIAGFGIANKVETIIFLPAMAISFTLTTLTSNAYGADDKKRISIFYKCGIGLSIFITIIFLAILYISFGSNIFGIARNNYITEIVKKYFTIIFMGYFCNCITCSIMGVFNGIKNEKLGLSIMLICYLVCRIPFIMISVLVFNRIEAIWGGILFSYIVCLIFSLNMKKRCNVRFKWREQL